MAQQRRECEVCVTEVPVAKIVECPGCRYGACASCQRAYGKPCCMSCRTPYTRRFALSTLGRSYVSEVWKPYNLAQHVEAERRVLPLTQAWVDWEQERRRIQSRRRFGDRTPIPTQPQIPQMHVGAVFACPSNTCRGFVAGGECGTCKARVCGRCREAIEGVEGVEGVEGAHVCNEESVASLAAMSTDCKPCPSCRTLIHKTMGCDHMCCTFCGVHFMWTTLALLANSTNRHYADAAPLRQGAGSGQQQQHEQRGDAHDLCELDHAEDGIPRDVFEQQVGDPLMAQLLYDDRQVVMYTKRELYDEARIMEKASAELHGLRVQYLMKELDEARWTSRIMTVYTRRDKALQHGALLTMLLVTLRGMQRDVYNGRLSRSDVVQQLREMYAMLDGQFGEIQAEFGGTRLRARGDVLAVTIPPILI